MPGTSRSKDLPIYMLSVLWRQCSERLPHWDTTKQVQSCESEGGRCHKSDDRHQNYFTGLFGGRFRDKSEISEAQREFERPCAQEIERAPRIIDLGFWLEVLSFLLQKWKEREIGFAHTNFFQDHFILQRS